MFHLLSLILLQTELSPDDEFLIVACDGLWDKLTHAEACLYVSKLLHYKTLEDATHFLMDEAMDRNTKGELVEGCRSGVGGAFWCFLPSTQIM